MQTLTPQLPQQGMLPPPFGVADTPGGLRGPHDGAFHQGKGSWSTGQSQEHRLLARDPEGLWLSLLQAGRVAAQTDRQPLPACVP